MIPRFLLLLFLIASAQAVPPWASADYNKRFIEGSLTPITKPAKTFYVSGATGDDANAGEKSSPVKTLAAAQKLVRAFREAEGNPRGGVKVLIAPGTYKLTKSLSFDRSDSGTKQSPTVWQGVSKDKVILTGGTEVPASDFMLIEHKAGLARLHPDARGNVMGAHLADYDISGFGNGKGDYGSLTMDGHFLQLAQWPNVGYNHIDKIQSSGPSTRFLPPGQSPPSYSEENPSGGKFTTREKLSNLVTEEFRGARDMVVQGYLHNDWHFEEEPVGRIADDGTIQLLKHTRYGIKNDIKSLPRRVKLVNVLAELDQPGEWYYDHQLGGLFVWPIDGFDPDTSRVVIPSGDALIKTNGTSHFTFRGVTLENTHRIAVDISGGNHVLLADSIVRNGTERGVSINGGKYNGIAGCEFHDLDSAFHIRGGDIPSLERCYNFAINNNIHRCRKRGYGMISLGGCGIRFAHNLMHDMNGAVSFSTVDMLMEFNEFYNVGYEMGDFNVAYTGAQWWTMGNVIRYNFAHHIIEPGGHPVCPFRNDDGGAGLNIFGNVFYRTGRCAAQFNGPANTMENNVAIDMSHLWWTLKSPNTEEMIQERWEDLKKFGTTLAKGDKGDYLYNAEKVVGEKFWEKSPWKDEYPEVAEFIDINPWGPTLGRVERNYAVDIPKPFHIHGGDGSPKGMESKRQGTFKDLPAEGTFRFPKELKMSRFQDPKTLNFAFKKSFRLMKDFTPIPFEKIGLRESPFRSDVPDKETYRAATYEKFKNDRGQRYNAAVVNARYPKPTYLK